MARIPLSRSSALGLGGVLSLLGLLAGPAWAHLALVRQGLDSAGSLEPGDRFGSSVATGDFDGDGFDDLATGAPMEDVGVVNAAGSVVVSYGSAAGITHVGAQSFDAGTVGGVAQANAQFGYALATGDFDHDGDDDLAIGAPYETVAGAANAGRVYVLRGGPGGLAGPALMISQDGGPGGPETPDNFGFALAAGLLNGDLFEDLVVGSPGEDSSAGAVFWFAGSATGLHEATGAFFKQADLGGTNVAGDRFGASLAVGNIVGDAHDDIAVGAPLRSEPARAEVGMVYVIFGAAAGPTGAGALLYGAANTAAGSDAFAHFGHALAAGRFSNDARLGLAIGEPRRDLPGALAAGRVVFARGGAAGLDFAGFVFPVADQGLLATTPDPGDHFGEALAAGDWNHDGLDDVAIGAPGEGGAVNDSGVVHLALSNFMGPVATSRVLTQFSLSDSAVAGDEFGAALAFGRFDDTEKANLAIGTPGQDDDEDCFDDFSLHPTPFELDAGAVFISAPWRQPSQPGGAPVLPQTSRSIVVSDCSGALVYTLRPFDLALPASTTKVMTVLLACERSQLPINDPDHVSLDAEYVVPDWIAIRYADRRLNIGHKAWLYTGQHISLLNLMYGAMLVSGNDAAYSISQLIAPGNEPRDASAFVALMNQRAAELGMTQTQFNNPAGIDVIDYGGLEMYTTAYDMWLLSRAAMQNPLFRTLAATVTWEIPDFIGSGTMTYTNVWRRNLLGRIPELTGLKPGGTSRAGNTRLISAAVAPFGEAFAAQYGFPDTIPVVRGGTIGLEGAALLRLALSRCGLELPPLGPDLGPPRAMELSGVPTASNQLAGGVSDEDDEFAAESLIVDVLRQSGSGPLNVGLEVQEPFGVVLAPGGTASWRASPFQGHLGWLVSNLDTVPASVRITATPPGTPLNVSIPPFGSVSVPAQSGTAATFVLTLQNLTTIRPAALHVDPVGLTYEVSLPNATSRFAATLRRSPPIQPEEFHVETAGRDPAPGGSVYVAVHSPGIVVVAVESESRPAPGFRLQSVGPNPFRTRALLAYETDRSGRIELEVFDVQGRRVRRLERAAPPGPGSIAWSGESDSGRALGAGLYFYRLAFDGRPASRGKIALVR